MVIIAFDIYAHSKSITPYTHVLQKLEYVSEMFLYYSELDCCCELYRLNLRLEMTVQRGFDN